MTGARIDRPAPAEDTHAAADRRRAARALLRHPLLHAGGPGAEDLRLVRRHRAELTKLFADGLGYRLVVEPAAARLFKAGIGRDPTRPAMRRNGKPFTPRAYAMLCLTVAALTRCKNQLLVDELVAQVRSAAADAGVDVDLDAIADRRAMYAALSALVDLGVLHERDGDLEHWADQHTAALLDVRRDRLGLLVSAPLGACATADDLLDVAALPSAAGGARVAIRRRLVESPVLSTTDLTDEQAEWWRRNRNREREWFRDRLGLDLELRAEGALAVDQADELTDVQFPGTGSTKHLALLLAERLVDIVRDGERAGGGPIEAGPADRAWRTVAAGAVHAIADGVFAEWGPGFKREYRDDPGAALAEAAGLLVAVGLVRLAAGGDWQVHAAAARYATSATIVEPVAPEQASLFDEPGFDGPGFDDEPGEG